MPVVEAKFLDYDEYLENFYSALAGKIKQNHIFSCSSSECVKNKLIVDLRISDLEQDKKKSQCHQERLHW